MTCSRSHSWFAPELAQNLTISGIWSSEFSISTCSLLACWFWVRNIINIGQRAEIMRTLKGNLMAIKLLWKSWAIDLFCNVFMVSSPDWNVIIAPLCSLNSCSLPRLVISGVVEEIHILLEGSKCNSNNHGQKK